MVTPSTRRKLGRIWELPLWDYIGYAALFAFIIFRWESLHWAWVCLLLAALLIIRGRWRGFRR